MASFIAGGGQGDDVLSQVDAYIDGRIIGGGKKSGGGADGMPPSPTLMQMLMDGVKSLIGGEPKARKKRDNAMIRGVPEPAQMEPIVHSDGTSLGQSEIFFQDLMGEFGKFTN